MINLCIHGIGSPGRALEPGEESYWVSPEFYEQVLCEVDGRDDVSISFDDGNISDLELGLPGLLRHGRTARFFVLAGRIGQPGSLGLADLRALRDQGMTVGTHGLRHVPWRHLPMQEQQREWCEARSSIATAVGVPVDEAALPLGRYDRSVLRQLRALGYTRVWTSDRRPASAGGWLQPRFSLRRGDSIQTLRDEMLAPALRSRVRSEAVGLLKRWR